MSFRIEIDASALIRGMQRLDSAIPGAIKESKVWATKTVVSGAQAIVPVRTGRLKRSIGIVAETTDSISIGTDLFYAYVVEFGSIVRHLPARPYIGPQYDKVRNNITAVFVDSLKRQM